MSSCADLGSWEFTGARQLDAARASRHRRVGALSVSARRYRRWGLTASSLRAGRGCVTRTKPGWSRVPAPGTGGDRRYRHQAQRRWPVAPTFCRWQYARIAQVAGERAAGWLRRSARHAGRRVERAHRGVVSGVRSGARWRRLHSARCTARSLAMASRLRVKVEPGIELQVETDLDMLAWAARQVEQYYRMGPAAPRRGPGRGVRVQHPRGTELHH